MSQAKSSTAPNYDPIAKPMTEVNWDQHQANLAKRRAAREKNRPVHLKCLEAEHAARFEATKPTFEFDVRAVFRRPDVRGRLQTISETRVITAQSENDAWAKFCDSIGSWPNPRDCQREIKQLAAA